MDYREAANRAIASLRVELDAAKFSAEEWAHVELAVNQLAELAVLIPVASDSQLVRLHGRAMLARVVLRNFTTAKAIDAEGVVMRVLRSVFTAMLAQGLDSLEKVLVAA